MQKRKIFDGLELTPTPQDDDTVDQSTADAKPTEEFGGRDGLEPTRYGDWEKDGILSDF